MNIEPTIIRETKVVEKQGYLPQEVTVSEEIRVPLWEMARFNTLDNTKKMYSKRQGNYRTFSTDYRDISFSDEIKGVNR